jgi:hypothetical protein
MSRYLYQSVSILVHTCVADPDWIRIQSGQWIRIRNPDPDPGAQKVTHKNKKGKKFHVLKCWMFSLRAECFSCSLDVLYGGLGIVI